ncbi:hypothetical protein M0805_001190 [Coniferiporia weirii]|nr:hypothetical protein M0805_001190 [Coniferiporia weirii]
MSVSLPETHRVVRLHPADLSIHVETLPTPKIEHPDDAIIKIKLAGLCGSDLHGYRGHEKLSQIFVTGHEFIGEVVALGSSYSPNATDRPPLYSTLSIGDKVVSPFTSSCAECHFCRSGFTSRCAHQLLFGSAALPGGQAQYVRVPRAGGTLFVVASAAPDPQTQTQTLAGLADPSLLLLADILPTGVFAALQALQHPNVLPVIRGERFPLASVSGLAFPRGGDVGAVNEGAAGIREMLLDPVWPSMQEEDRILTIAIVGLGPVGVCATIALLDFLSALRTRFRLIAIDLNAARRENIRAIYSTLPTAARGSSDSEFVVGSPEEAERFVQEATGGVGCNAVLEVVGNNPALSLAYTLLRPFGVLVSVGVHQAPPVPFTGRELYAKNVAAVFGRCPVRTVFPLAADLLRRRQDVFGGSGSGSGAGAGAGVERVVSLDEAPEAYAKFAKGEWGKVAFDPWK